MLFVRLITMHRKFQRQYLGRSATARPVSNAYLKQIATTAEQLGYDGLLIPTGSGNLDPFITAAILANVTSKIKYTLQDKLLQIMLKIYKVLKRIY